MQVTITLPDIKGLTDFSTLFFQIYPERTKSNAIAVSSSATQATRHDKPSKEVGRKGRTRAHGNLRSIIHYFC